MKYAELVGFTEEEAAWLFDAAELNGVKFFMIKPFMSGTRNYRIEFMSQKDMNDFNFIAMTILEYQNKEKFTSLMNFSEESAEKIFETAKKNGVSYKIYSVEGHDDDYYKNYRLRFPTIKDLNKFRKVCFP